jgi:hypothetical protein
MKHLDQNVVKKLVKHSSQLTLLELLSTIDENDRKLMHDFAFEYDVGIPIELQYYMSSILLRNTRLEILCHSLKPKMIRLFKDKYKEQTARIEIPNHLLPTHFVFCSYQAVPHFIINLKLDGFKFFDLSCWQSDFEYVNFACCENPSHKNMFFKFQFKNDNLPKIENCACPHVKNIIDSEPFFEFENTHNMSNITKGPLLWVAKKIEENMSYLKEQVDVNWCRAISVTIILLSAKSRKNDGNQCFRRLPKDVVVLIVKTLWRTKFVDIDIC